MIVDLVLNNAKAYVNSDIADCSLAINEGKILKIGKETNMPKTDTKIDLKNLLVLPGLIDPHVHLRDEGKAYKEDFHSGTAAAAAGGITTVLDMPNNKPVTMSVETVRNRMHKAKEKALVNIGFFSEFPREVENIKSITEEGIVAFKLFMAQQVGGLDIDDDNAMMEAFGVVGKLNVPIAIHAEDRKTLREAEEELKRTRRDGIEAFLKAHSEDVEVRAIKRTLELSRKTRAHVHFCHVSTEKGLQTITEAKKTGAQVTCETTPHNLLLSADDLRRVGTLALTMPPVRDKKHIAALWDGVSKGWIDMIGSDHAPHTSDEKIAETIWKVKVGISGLETTLPLLLTEVKHGRLSVGDVVRLMAEKPAETYKLTGRGCLKNGSKADLTVVNLRIKYKIEAAKFKSRAKYSPFEGWPVEGKPAKTFVGGHLVMDDSEIVAEKEVGEIIRRA